MSVDTANRIEDPEFARWLVTKYRPMIGAQSMSNEIDVFDAFRQATMTDLVRRSLQTAWETADFIGDQIAPLVPIQDRTVSRGIAEIAAMGVGQFRAPDASPATFNTRIRFDQERTQLLLLDEKTEITEDIWLRMISQVPEIRVRAGVDLTTMGRIMQFRNETLTETMRWTAMKGNDLVVNYDNGQQLRISYNYESGHKPTAVVPWTDTENSTPIDDLRAWQRIISDSVGTFGRKIHMNTMTWTLLQRSNQARGYLAPADRPLWMPTVADIENLLWGGQTTDRTGGMPVSQPQIIVTDSGYRDASVGFERGAGAMTKFLDDGEVMVTTDYVFEGERIADVPDGLVALSNGFQGLTWRQGPQSEIIIDHNSKTQFFRQASARIVRLRRPGCFVLGTAY